MKVRKLKKVKVINTHMTLILILTIVVTSKLSNEVQLFNRGHAPNSAKMLLYS